LLSSLWGACSNNIFFWSTNFDTKFMAWNWLSNLWYVFFLWYLNFRNIYNWNFKTISCFQCGNEKKNSYFREVNYHKHYFKNKENFLSRFWLWLWIERWW
jgi:hypothetical protein